MGWLGGECGVVYEDEGCGERDCVPKPLKKSQDRFTRSIHPPLYLTIPASRHARQQIAVIPFPPPPIAMRLPSFPIPSRSSVSPLRLPGYDDGGSGVL